MPIRKTPQYSNTQSATSIALTARTIFAPASNTKGVKIIGGSALENQTAGGTVGHFVMATSAPSSLSDGLSVSTITGGQNASPNVVIYKIIDDIFIPSGYGLYWISTAAGYLGTDVSWTDA